MMSAVRSVARLVAPSAALLLTATCPSVSSGTVVTIENTVLIDDRSERGVEQAIERAVEHSMRGATTLGLASIELQDAVVLNDRVLVRVVARDDAADQAQDDRADEEVAVVDIASDTSEAR